MSWLKAITSLATNTGKETKKADSERHGTIEIGWGVAGTALVEVSAPAGATEKQIAESFREQLMQGEMKQKWDELTHAFVRALKADWPDAKIMAVATIADHPQMLSGAPKDSTDGS